MTDRPEACPACGETKKVSDERDWIKFKCGYVWWGNGDNQKCNESFDVAVRLRAELKRIADRTTDQWAQAVARNALEGQG